jgi:ribosomal protein S18 acetylase RimI-like enzyme
MLLDALTALPEDLRLRPMRSDDLAFLSMLYASTRRSEMDQVDWSDDQKRDFLQQQFQAQHHHYQEHFSDAEFLVIEKRKPGVEPCDSWQRIGRIYLDEREDEIRLIDIALMPAHRNAGLGSQFLQALLRIAKGRDLAVRLHVEQFNPAAAWYRRYGFELIEERGIYLFMEWRRP